MKSQAIEGIDLFAYRLAKELGEWDVTGLLHRMTWKQFVGWMRYYQQEPFGEERADLRSAIVASVIANANRDGKRRPRPFSPRDFMPYADRQSKTGKQQAVVTDANQWRGMLRTVKAEYATTAAGRQQQVSGVN